jgi:hypothetical protein
MPLTPQDFVSKWKRVTAREKQTNQEHFIDVCHWSEHFRFNPKVIGAYLTVSILRPSFISARAKKKMHRGKPVL